MPHNCVHITKLFNYFFIFYCHDILRFHRRLNFPLGFQTPLGNVLEIAVKVKVVACPTFRFIKAALSKLAVAVVLSGQR